MPGQTRLLTYVAATGVAGAGVTVWVLPHVRLVAALATVAAVLVAEWFSTRIRDGVEVSLTNIVVLVAIMTVGFEVAVLAWVGVVPVVVARASDRVFMRVVFNAGQCAISAFAAGAAYTAFLTGVSGVFPDVRTLAAAGLAALAYSVTNLALVSGVVAVSSPDGFLATLLPALRLLVLQVPYVAIAFAAAILLEQQPWALVVLAVPVVIARHAMLAFQRLDEAYDRLVRSFVKTIEIKDRYTRGHSERVATLAVLVAEELGVGYEQRRLTRYAALLHDIGKIGVSRCVINKAGPLDADEFEQMKQHPGIGADILHDIDFLAPAIDIVRSHHERLDGRGYPDGLSAAQLSRIVRIVTAADAFDAMTSTRSYRRAMEVAAAITELRRCADTQFDPQVVEALAVVAERVAWAPTRDFANEATMATGDAPSAGVITPRDDVPRDALR